MLRIKERYKTNTNAYSVLSAAVAAWTVHRNSQKHAYIQDEVNRILEAPNSANVAYVLDRAKRRAKQQTLTVAEVDNLHFFYSITARTPEGTFDIFKEILEAAKNVTGPKKNSSLINAIGQKLRHDLPNDSLVSIGLATHQAPGPGGHFVIHLIAPNGENLKIKRVRVPSNNTNKDRINIHSYKIPTKQLKQAGEYFVEIRFLPVNGEPKALPRRGFFIIADYKSLKAQET